MTKVITVEVKRHASIKCQTILKEVLKKHNLLTNGCFVYVTEDNLFGVSLHGIQRKDALKICNETMEKIDKLIGVGPSETKR